MKLYEMIKCEQTTEFLTKSESKSVEYNLKSYCGHSRKSELLLHRSQKVRRYSAPQDLNALTEFSERAFTDLCVAISYCH